MNPQQPHQPEPTAAEEAAVRAALADAGEVGPMPTEVADRLDAVVEGLAAERSGNQPDSGADHQISVGSLPVDHPEAAVVRPLDPAARRRRTQVAVLLGAAAAVVVVGISAGVMGGQSDTLSSASESMASDSPHRDEDAAGASAADTTSDLARQESADDAGSSDENAASRAASNVPEASAEADLGDGPTYARLQDRVEDGPLRTIRAQHLREDLVAIQHVSLPDPDGADYTGTTLVAPDSFVCPTASYGAGHLVGATYEGRSVVVSFHEPVGRTQEAEVLACGTADLLHSTTLPVG